MRWTIQLLYHIVMLNPRKSGYGNIEYRILSEKKKEDRGVIISMAELEKYFGKEVTPVKMKEQIMSLLDEWKEKQPPELKKPEKKADLEK